jgi:hypothetical protein
MLMSAYRKDPDKTLGIIQAIEELERKSYEKAVVLKGYEDTHQLTFFKPYEYQKAIFDAFRIGFNIVVLPLSNKVGKSRAGAALVHSWAIGYEPWNEVEKDFVGRLGRTCQGDPCS